MPLIHTPPVIELKPSASHEDRGGQTAEILSAYLETSHAQEFCRLLWRRSAVISLVAWFLEALRIIPRAAFVATLLLFGTLAVVAAAAQWRMHARFRALIAGRQISS